MMQVIGGWYGRYVVLDADDTGSMDSRHWPREATLNNLELRERVARPGSITTQSLVIITNQSLVSPRLYSGEIGNKRVCFREQSDFWGTLSWSYFVSHDTMLEQFSVSDRKLGRGEGGHWGVSQLVINGLYPTFIPPSRSPHHLPSLANCLTFQFCSAPLHRDQSHWDVKWWSPEERENQGQGPGPEPSEIWNFSKTWPATSDAWPQELSKNHGASANIRHRWVVQCLYWLYSCRGLRQIRFFS